METETHLYPAWKEGVRKFLAHGCKEGDIVERQWLHDIMGLEMAVDSMTFALGEKLKLQFLTNFEKFREELLEEHQIDLAAVIGIGYRVLPSAEQTKAAFSDGIRDVRKGLRKMRSRLTNVNQEALTMEQRKENADALAKLGMLSGMVRKVPRMLGNTVPP